MPTFERDDVNIYYEDHGSGFPVLVIAPGGMLSAVEYWRREATPWNPIDQLSPSYRVIAMDQRNAGQSTAPIRATDGWHEYTKDQLALLEHLSVDQFHVMGMCIGGPYIMGLIDAAPDRVVSAVVMQSIGLEDNRDRYFDLFDSWANDLKPSHPDVSEETWIAFRKAMFGGDFVFNVSRDFVASCKTPMLVLMGQNDYYHPESISREIVSLAHDAKLVERWKEPEHQPAAKQAVEQFLAAHTPN